MSAVIVTRAGSNAVRHNIQAMPTGTMVPMTVGRVGAEAPEDAESSNVRDAAGGRACKSTFA